ncbi:hypothetical protein GDO81_013683 [Engystomops pustulosus]|uniref:Uncharacterized protein n=1 Tax=Engystomops pustulosus TaxID=76066 RepID=A0AAV7B4L2_ENGPU|nr:hypothetical protein GDO81_013683 [Engystomops pustulosus]
MNLPTKVDLMEREWRHHDQTVRREGDVRQREGKREYTGLAGLLGAVDVSRWSFSLSCKGVPEALLRKGTYSKVRETPRAWQSFP